MQISPVSILFASIMSSGRLQEMSLRQLQDMSSRRLEEVFSVTNFRLPRRLGKRKIVTLKTCWRRLQDQQMFAGFVINFIFFFLKLVIFIVCSISVSQNFFKQSLYSIYIMLIFYAFKWWYCRHWKTWWIMFTYLYWEWIFRIMFYINQSFLLNI